MNEENFKQICKHILNSKEIIISDYTLTFDGLCIWIGSGAISIYKINNNYINKKFTWKQRRIIKKIIEISKTKYILNQLKNGK